MRANHRSTLPGAGECRRSLRAPPPRADHPVPPGAAARRDLLRRGRSRREAGFKRNLCADIQGFSLHAAVRCAADDRKALEQLCRYITRPALANERVQCNAAGQVVLKLKTPWHDGTTHVVMSPLEFMQRLAALVPRPRLHLIRFHGVLAPNAKLRAMVVPQAPVEPADVALPAGCELTCATERSAITAVTLQPRPAAAPIRRCRCRRRPARARWRRRRPSLRAQRRLRCRPRLAGGRTHRARGPRCAARPG
jgi:hypothetical protein